MTDELDKLLNDFDDKAKKQKEEHKIFLEELAEKKDTFNSGFKELMSKTIRPTMTELLTKIRNHGHIAKIDDDKSGEHFQYIHEGYIVKLKKGNNYALVTVVGNHDHHKVFIYTAYSEKNSIKKLEASYELTEVTPELLTKCLTDAVSIILK